MKASSYMCMAGCLHGCIMGIDRAWLHTGMVVLRVFDDWNLLAHICIFGWKRYEHTTICTYINKCFGSPSHSHLLPRPRRLVIILSFLHLHLP